MEMVKIVHEVPKDMADGAKKFVDILEKVAPALEDGDLDFADAPELLAAMPDVWLMFECFIKSADDIKRDPMGCAVVLASMLDHAVDKYKETKKP